MQGSKVGANHANKGTCPFSRSSIPASQTRQMWIVMIQITRSHDISLPSFVEIWQSGRKCQGNRMRKFSTSREPTGKKQLNITCTPGKVLILYKTQLGGKNKIWVTSHAHRFQCNNIDSIESHLLGNVWRYKWSVKKDLVCLVVLSPWHLGRCVETPQTNH